VAPNDWVVVASRRGRLRARAYVTATVAPGQVFVPMHFADTNILTDDEFDPLSRQPAYKYGAVEVGLPERWDR
jgi:assimilatory nitrate reductase catalytic subunit